MAQKEYRDSWREIEVGWTDKQVRAKLGGPDKIEPGETGMVVWTYGIWPLAGKVTFKDSKVVGIKLPPFNTIYWTR
jgi:hypothetical protein